MWLIILQNNKKITWNSVFYVEVVAFSPLKFPCSFSDKIPDFITIGSSHFLILPFLLGGQCNWSCGVVGNTKKNCFPFLNHCIKYSRFPLGGTCVNSLKYWTITVKCEVNLLVKVSLKVSLDSIKVIHILVYIHSLGFQYDFLRGKTKKVYFIYLYWRLSTSLVAFGGDVL